MRIELRTRLALLLAVTLAVLSFTHPLANLFVLTGSVAVLAACGVRLRGVLPLLAKLSPIILLVGLAAGLTTPAWLVSDPELMRVLWQVGPVELRPGGLLIGGTYALRILAMVVVSWAVLGATSVEEVLDLAAHWRAPNWLSVMVSCALAAVPHLTARREQIQQAQQLRGVRLDDPNPLRRWWAGVAVMVPLISSSLTSADNLAVALSVRGYGAHETMTVLRDLSWRRADLVCTVLLVALGVAAVVGRLAFGLGRL